MSGFTTRAILGVVLAGFAAGCGTSLNLGSNDAGIPYDADCKAGTYVGSYHCTGGTGSPFAFSQDGPLSMALVPAGATTLAIAPDAALSSTAAGGTSTETLRGALDCPGRTLQGTAGDVSFLSPTFKGTLQGGGAFTATYDADASPPTLVDGVLDPPPSLGTTCTWSAQLQ
jgi:hypothetical protein